MGVRLGEYLKELRKDRGLGISQAARKAGCTRSYLYLVERGKRDVSLRTLYCLVNTLGGDMRQALMLLALDAGVPPEALGMRGNKDGIARKRHLGTCK